MEELVVDDPLLVLEIKKVAKAAKVDPKNEYGSTGGMMMMQGRYLARDARHCIMSKSYEYVVYTHRSAAGSLSRSPRAALRTAR